MVMIKKRTIDLNMFKQELEFAKLYYSEDSILNRPTVIGYEKKFRWLWGATQLNTFFVAADFGDELITADILDQFIDEAFTYALDHQTGWPRGYQSAHGVVVFLMSTKVDQEAMIYCEEISSAKMWAGFAIPVVIEKQYGYVHYYKKKPMWGRMYFNYFKKMILTLTGQ